MDELKTQLFDKDLEIEALRSELSQQMSEKVELRKMVFLLREPKPTAEETPANDEK